LAIGFLSPNRGILQSPKKIYDEGRDYFSVFSLASKFIFCYIEIHAKNTTTENWEKEQPELPGGFG